MATPSECYRNLTRSWDIILSERIIQDITDWPRVKKLIYALSLKGRLVELGAIIQGEYHQVDLTRSESRSYGASR